MADRFKQMMISKQQPMQHKLKAYEFLMEEIYRWRNELNRYKQSNTSEVVPVYKDMSGIKQELLKIKQFQKLKEECKMREDAKLHGDLESPLETTSNLMKSKKEHRRIMYDKDDYDHDMHMRTGREMMNDIMEAVTQSRRNHEDAQCPYDPLRELRADEFFVDEQIMEEDIEKLKQKNSYQKKSTNLSSTSTNPTTQDKQFVSREYVIMVKETLDLYKRKKAQLEHLKQTRNMLEEQACLRNGQLASKVTQYIIKHKDKIFDKDTQINDKFMSSDDGTDVTNDERIEAYTSIKNTIPTMNDEIERVLLIAKREKEEARIKLLKSKDLVISACGLVGRICKEIRITNSDGSVATIDVVEKNISDYMSLCGLKFEKLMRNNKLIKAQYERLVELNMQRGNKKMDFYETQEEADIYGFAEIKLRRNPEKDSDEESNY